MNVMMVRRQVKEEHVADMQAALAKLFQALEEAQLAGVRYASFRLSDGVTFGAFLALENGGDNPLMALPVYAELLENLEQWAEGPASVEPMTVVGSYRVF